MVVVLSERTDRVIAGGMDAWSVGISAPNSVHRGNDVGARLARHDDQHGRLAVGVPSRSDVLHRVDHIADVLKAHRRAVLVRHYKRLVLGGLVELIRGGDAPRTRSGTQLSLRAVGIRGSEKGAEVLEAEPQRVQHGRVHLDAHGRQGPAAYEDLAHAIDLRDALLED